MDCIFCKIIKGEIPSYTIYEDEQVKAFLDISPSSNGHTLLIPKDHYTDIYDLPSDTLLHIVEIAKQLGFMFEKKLNTNGFTLLQNYGDVQEIKHFHLHIKPYDKRKKPLLEVAQIYEQLK